MYLIVKDLWLEKKKLKSLILYSICNTNYNQETFINKSKEKVTKNSFVYLWIKPGYTKSYGVKIHKKKYRL